MDEKSEVGKENEKDEEIEISHENTALIRPPDQRINQKKIKHFFLKLTLRSWLIQILSFILGFLILLIFASIQNSISRLSFTFFRLDTQTFINFLFFYCIFISIFSISFQWIKIEKKATISQYSGLIFLLSQTISSLLTLLIIGFLFIILKLVVTIIINIFLIAQCFMLISIIIWFETSLILKKARQIKLTYLCLFLKIMVIAIVLFFFFLIVDQLWWPMSFIVDPIMLLGLYTRNSDFIVPILFYVIIYPFIWCLIIQSIFILPEMVNWGILYQFNNLISTLRNIDSTIKLTSSSPSASSSSPCSSDLDLSIPSNSPLSSSSSSTEKSEPLLKITEEKKKKQKRKKINKPKTFTRIDSKNLILFIIIFALICLICLIFTWSQFPYTSKKGGLNQMTVTYLEGQEPYIALVPFRNQDYHFYEKILNQKNVKDIYKYERDKCELCLPENVDCIKIKPKNTNLTSDLQINHGNVSIYKTEQGETRSLQIDIEINKQDKIFGFYNLVICPSDNTFNITINFGNSVHNWKTDQMKKSGFDRNCVFLVNRECSFAGIQNISINIPKEKTVDIRYIAGGENSTNLYQLLQLLPNYFHPFGAWLWSDEIYVKYFNKM
ncbi:inner nuclear membrane protein heh2-related [Anaeramoeba flamelloides]|uniref:Inner nuclear membrane protein heh2-related n=1 Tax=Anaeramoeba flamelloides TaxID=1746091 RepID=A0ABQ8YHZ7_9EUKA|nr:inner nuclear membrane protein heh2-related [Anaeramoeba flamelloides]